MDWTFLGAFTIAVVGLCGTWLTARIQHKGRPENAMIDQLQDEMADIRKRLAKFEARDRVYIPHIIRLNMHIEQGLGPPAPKIPRVIQDYLDAQDDEA